MSLMKTALFRFLAGPQPLLAACLVMLTAGCSMFPARTIEISQSAQVLDAYDFLEIPTRTGVYVAGNPFLDGSLSGVFEMADGSRRWTVDGFCDADDGSVFRIRFMPTVPGEYRYSVRYRYSRKGLEKSSRGTFTVRRGGRRGPIRVDPEHRWHFIWEGTREHYFFNGTTAYWLGGWRDDRVIEDSI